MRIEEIYNEYDKMLGSSKMPFIKCKTCCKAYYYPRTVCPFCGSSDIEIMNSSGAGEIYSCTEFSGRFYGIIKFQEGFGAYMDVEGKNVATGKKIIIKFREISGKVLPYASVD
jgi:uncharacterized OB-fold protein